MRQAFLICPRWVLFSWCLILTGFLLLPIATGVSHALEVKGTLTQNNLQVGDCSLAEIVVSYNFGVLMGEPTVYGTYKWQAGSGTEKNCLPANTTVYIKITNSAGQPGYIPVSPTVPKSGSGFGFNTTGSPSWGKLISKDVPKSERYFSAQEAKALWKSGFEAMSFTVHGTTRKNSSSPKKKEVQKKAAQCKPGWQMRTKVGYERYRCSNCNILEIEVGKNEHNQATYNGSIYADKVISALCSNQQDAFWAQNKESDVEKYLREKKDQQRRAEEERKRKEQERLKREFEAELAKSGISLGAGDIQVTLTWDASCDLDLHVKDPNGETIFYSHKKSRSGGELDVDDQNGHGPENVYWRSGNAPDGAYKVHVKYYSGSRPTDYKIRVLVDGRAYFHSGYLRRAGSKEYVTTFRKR